MSGLMDDRTLVAAFHAHTKGEKRFSRRMAINLADMDGTTPRQLTLRLERMNLLNEGSWSWFVENGGISQDQIEAVRQQRNTGASHDRC